MMKLEQAAQAPDDAFPSMLFNPLTNDFECYSGYATAGKEKTPVAAYIADRVLTLPLFADLQIEDVDRICDIILGK